MNDDADAPKENLLTKIRARVEECFKKADDSTFPDQKSVALWQGLICPPYDDPFLYSEGLISDLAENILAFHARELKKTLKHENKVCIAPPPHVNFSPP